MELFTVIIYTTVVATVRVDFICSQSFLNCPKAISDNIWMKGSHIAYIRGALFKKEKNFWWYLLISSSYASGYSWGEQLRWKSQDQPQEWMTTVWLRTTIRSMETKCKAGKKEGAFLRDNETLLWRNIRSQLLNIYSLSIILFNLFNWYTIFQ